jgi:hypothetical protein
MDKAVPHLFISYALPDRDFARQLARSVEHLGAVPWLSEHGVHAGQNWLEALRENLKRSDVMVLVMPSEAAPAANSTFFEAGAAKAMGKNIVVVVPDLGLVDRDNIPFDLAQTVLVDASKQPIDSIAEAVLGAAR